MPYVLSSQIACTSEEVFVIILKLDLSFFLNILEVEKMKLVSKLTHSMFKVAFSLVSASQGDVLPPGNPSKEMDTWKGKCKLWR